MAYVRGTSKADTLKGTSRADYIVGNNGNDTITGGDGVDVMKGGAGADTFVLAKGDGGGYRPRDIIADFKVGTDKLQLPGAIVSTKDAREGTHVRYGDAADSVLLSGLHKVDVSKLTNPGTTPTPTPPKPDPAPTPTPDPTPPTTPPPQTVGGLEGELLALINKDRAAAKLAPLVIDKELDVAADRHTADMLNRDFFSHTAPGGGSPGDRIKAAGYGANGWGENIAYVSQGTALDLVDVQQLHKNLMASPGHKANLMSSAFKEVGLGLAAGDYKGQKVAMLTEAFGTPNAAEAKETDKLTSGTSPTPAPEPKPTEPTPAPKPTEPDPTPAPKPTEPDPEPAPKPTEPAPKPTEPAPKPTEPAPTPKPTEPAPTPEPAPPANGNDLPAHKTVYHETFDDGKSGKFTNAWGNVVKGDGEVTITSNAGKWQDGGLMMTKADGLGYGLYEFQVSFNKNTPGGYALVWPEDDKWPGPEMDLVEVLRSGQGYATIHRNNGGKDAYDTYYMPKGIDFTKPHTFAMNWQPGKIEFFVDGKEYAETTKNVPKAAVDGGLDALPSIGVQTRWNIDAQGGTDFKATVHDFQYSVIA